MSYISHLTYLVCKMPPHLRAYSIHNAVFETFIRAAIGSPPRQSRTLTTTSKHWQKLSRKQREQSNATLSPEDKERIAKAAEKAAQRAEKKAEQDKYRRREGNSAQKLLKQLEFQRKVDGGGGSKSAGLGENGKKKGVMSEETPENEGIAEASGSDVIQLIDREGKFHKGVRLRDVLDDLDRGVEKLVLVKGNKGQEGDGIPVCKIFSFEYLEERKRKIEGRSADLARGEKASKELEMTWTIGGADLDLKLRQMRRFLEEGRRVDVSLQRKFRRRVPEKTAEEMEGLVGMVRSVAKEVKGAREYKEAEGELAKTLDLHFEGPRGGIREKAKDEDAQDLPEPEIAGAAAS